MTLSAYAGFVGLALVLAVTPGPDTFLALRFALLGRRPGVWAASGTSLAIFGWAALAAVGVAAVLSASPVAYGLLAALGGAYLLFLGGRALHAARSRTCAPAAAPASDRGADQHPGETTAGYASGKGAFVAGVATCMTNPKTGLFFMALFPQFVAPGADALYVTLALGGTVALVVFAYLTGLVVAADVARGWLARPPVANTIEAASGAILAGLGAYMVLEAARDFLM